VVGGESSASRLGRFNSEEKNSSVPLKEVWIGPRGGLGASGKGNILLSCQVLKYNPRSFRQ